MARTGFGLRAYNRRIELGLSRTYVAKKAGIAYQNLSKIEDGRVKCPLGDTASALADILQTTVAYLVNGIGFPDSVNVPSGNTIPVLNWEEAPEWCKVDNKKLSEKDRQHIQNPTDCFEKDVFAVKVQSDAMQCATGRGLPRGYWAICRPSTEIKTDKFMIFHDEGANKSFVREAVIDGSTYLKPLNPHYKTLVLTGKIIPIAEVIGISKSF